MAHARPRSSAPSLLVGPGARLRVGLDRGLDMAEVDWHHHCMADSHAVTRYDPFDGALSLSLATRVGNLIYTSGMLGVGADMKVPDEPKEEFRLLFASIGGILEAMGTSLQYTLEMTNFFAGDFDAVYAAFNEVRDEVFGKELPASTSVRVGQLLHPDAHVEVKVVAAMPAET